MIQMLVPALLLVAQAAAPPTTIPRLEVPSLHATLELTPALVHSLPRAKATTTATEHDQAAAFEGVELRTLLSKAGVPSGAAIRGEYLCWVVTLEAADGYRVVFALAELDPAFTDRVVLLADTRDGKALSEQEAPLRLVVPDEKRPARWIRQVVRVTASAVCQPSRGDEATRH